MIPEYAKQPDKVPACESCGSIHFEKTKAARGGHALICYCGAATVVPAHSLDKKWGRMIPNRLNFSDQLVEGDTVPPEGGRGIGGKLWSL